MGLSLRRSAALVASLCLGELAASGCTGDTAQQDDCFWIGSVNPLTGGLGPVGLALENAAKLAVQDLNSAAPRGIGGATGGPPGKKLCLATADDRTNPMLAKSRVDALVTKHNIRAVNGCAASSATLAAAEYTESRGYTLISCCSTSPKKTVDHPLVYRTVPSDALQGVALADFAKSEGARNVAAIYIDGVYGSALENEFEKAFVGEGRTITKAVAYKEAQSSYVGLVNEALGTNPAPDSAVLIAYPVEGAQIIKDWKASGVGRGVKWLGTDGLQDTSFAISVSADVAVFKGTAPIPNGRFYKGFEERYKRTYGGEKPGIFTSNQYDAVILIGLAMFKVGGEEEPDKIRAAIPAISRGPGMPVNPDDLAGALDLVSRQQSVDYAGASGEVDIDDRGDVIGPGYRVWSVRPGGRGLKDEDVCFKCGPASPPATGIACQRGDCEPTQ